MYDSPIDKIIGEMQSQLVKDEEGKLMVQVTQTIGYNIDKDELIKALNYDRQQYEKGYKDGLNASKWIPVSERLPEKQDCYLVTTKWKGSYSGDVYIETNMAVYREKPKEWDCADVIAWQPLPEPYNE